MCVCVSCVWMDGGCKLYFNINSQIFTLMCVESGTTRFVSDDMFRSGSHHGSCYIRNQGRCRLNSISTANDDYFIVFSYLKFTIILCRIHLRRLAGKIKPSCRLFQRYSLCVCFWHTVVLGCNTEIYPFLQTETLTFL